MFNDISLETKGLFRSLCLNTIKQLDEKDMFKQAPESEVIMANMTNRIDELIEMCFELIEEMPNDETRGQYDIDYANDILDFLMDLMLSINVLFLGADQSLRILATAEGFKWNKENENDDNNNDEE